MKKRFFGFIVSAFILNILFCGLSAYASARASSTQDEAYEYEQITGGVAIKSVDISKSGTNIVIPEQIGDKYVLEVDLCNSNLTSLDVSHATKLKILKCNNTNLSTLDLSKNTNLLNLDCANNHLTKLDVSKNTALTHLYCYSNYLATLDLSNNTDLILLNCKYNHLTTLDISKNIHLSDLHCGSNFISDVSALIKFDFTAEHSGDTTPQISFSPATDISINSTTMTADKALELNASVTPDTASIKEITWSIKDPGDTRAKISGNILKADYAGKIVVTATIIDGKAIGTDITKDFTITVNSKTSNVTTVCIIAAVFLVLAGAVSLFVIRKKHCK